jgi:hypothetical protein
MTDARTFEAVDVVLEILRKAGAALPAADIKKGLIGAGVAPAGVDRHWKAIQPLVSGHPGVDYDAKARVYRWVKPAVVRASDAFDRIMTGRLPAGERVALAAIVRAALDATPSPNGKPATAKRASDAGPDAVPDAVPDAAVDGVAAARQRQAAIDAARALAELAIEVEELTAKQASAETLVHRLRARVNRSGLEPIDRAGAETTFDRKRHRSIGGSIRDGAPVFVVRPGYVWKAAEEDVLIAKAVVEE